ncbi:MAG: hypothetical protein HRT88_13425 [Lentisphaeraceae bacterium]|nr:hypothetical protein [Lentisphaeraceae bacterium]
MLISITIISILMSILLPRLAKAKTNEAYRLGHSEQP